MFRASRGYQSLEDAGLRCCLLLLLLPDGNPRGPFGMGWWAAGCTQPGSCHTRAGLRCDPWGPNGIPLGFSLGFLRGARCAPDVAGAGYGVGGSVCRGWGGGGPDKMGCTLEKPPCSSSPSFSDGSDLCGGLEGRGGCPKGSLQEWVSRKLTPVTLLPSIFAGARHLAGLLGASNAGAKAGTLLFPLKKKRCLLSPHCSLAGEADSLSRSSVEGE